MSGSGFLLYDKPAGITSFSSLAGFKKLKPAMKFGHAGTLDRFATGLLIVMAGNYSHLAPWFLGLDKAYKAEICFGTETDTLDPEGSIIRSGIIPSKDELENCLPGFIGEQYQVPPDYSALHVKGTRASDLARKGCHPDLAARKISIFRLDLLSCQRPCATLNVECSSGTYIRALARDIAATCGTCAHVRNLRRTRVGPFPVEDALTDPLPTAETGSLPPLKHLDPATAISIGLDVGYISLASQEQFRNGFPGALSQIEIASAGLGDVAVFSKETGFLGVAARKPEGLKYGFVVSREEEP